MSYENEKMNIVVPPYMLKFSSPISCEGDISDSVYALIEIFSYDDCEDKYSRIEELKTQIKRPSINLSKESQNFFINPLLYDINSFILDRIKQSKEIPAYGIGGIFQCYNKKHMIVITEVKEQGYMLDNKIYCVDKVEFVSLSPEDNFKMENILTPDLKHHKDLLESKCFIFSYSYPLWNHLQFYSQLSSDDGFKVSNKAINMDKNRFKRYIWNQHLFEEAIPSNKPYICKLIRGSFESKILKEDIQIATLSRIDSRNAGTRFTTRGLNLKGEGAITVESELILSSKYHISSYLQLRSSFPLIWTQFINNFSYKPPVIIDLSDKQVVKNVIKSHFDDVKENILDGSIHILNLLRTTCDESKLSKTFESIFDELELSDVSYKPIPLGWGMQSLFYLMDQVTEPLTHNSYFLAKLNSNNKIDTILNMQKGIFRTNCMDCMDRTSIAQFGLLRRILPSLLNSVMTNSEGNSQCFKKFSEFETLKVLPALRQLWANHANNIANYYTGTGIVNEAIIREGTNCQYYSWRDQIICGTRFYLNNIHDPTKKFWLDKFLALSPNHEVISEYTIDNTNVNSYLDEYYHHLLKCKTNLGASPTYRTSFISSSRISAFDKQELNSALTVYLINLFKIATFQRYCLENELDSNLIIRLIPYFEANFNL